MNKLLSVIVMLCAISQLSPAGEQNMSDLCNSVLNFDPQGVAQSLDDNRHDTEYVHTGPYGASPLVSICYRAYENDEALTIIDILLKNGADMRPTKHQVTPLHAIVLGFASNLSSGEYEILLDRCCTAIDLLYKSFNKDEDNAFIIVNLANDLTSARNKTGQMAIEIAFEHALADIVNKLLTYTRPEIIEAIDLDTLIEQNKNKQNSLIACAEILNELRSKK